MSKTILVTGGAGFIGSHTVKLLLDEGYDVIILDNLSTGYLHNIPKNIKFYKLDLADKDKIKKTFMQNKIDAVMHFAGSIEAGESMINPKKFYRNNVLNTLNLLDVMLEFNVKNIIFSSSAAIFGMPKKIPITEKSEKNPINVYGRTKLMAERILEDYDTAYGLRSICLRYFNAAGAAFGLKEEHEPESHLIPIALEAAAGKRKKLQIYGTDYPTKDGTCIRDYIHVVDLANAHIMALDRLLITRKSEQFNLGSGKGYSVIDVLDAIREVTKREVHAVKAKRRPGDPPVVIADSSKIRKEIGWKQKFSLKDMVRSAWEST